MPKRRLSEFVCRVYRWGHSRQLEVRRRIIWALIGALLFSFIPWTPPALTPAMERAVQDTFPGMQWAAPLALEITRWTDEALTSLMGPTPVYAAGTLTISMSSDAYAVYTTTTPAEQFSYYLVVTNTDAPGGSCHVTLTQNLPAELRFERMEVLDNGGVEDSCWLASSASGGSVIRIYSDPYDPSCKLGGEQDAGFRIRTVVQGPLADTDWVTSLGGSFAAYNVDDGELVSYPADVTVPVYAPELAIAKEANPRAVTAETEWITLTLSVWNSGRYALRSHPTLGGPFTLIVTDGVPLRAALVSATPFSSGGMRYGTVEQDGDTLIWTVPFLSTGLGDLKPGDTLTATMVITVTPPFTYGDAIVNANYRVSVAEANRVKPPHADGEPVAVPVLGYPDLSIAKSVAPKTVYPSRGGTWTYWITVTNHRPSATGDAVGLVITDAVPANAVVESMSCSVPCDTSATPAPAGTTIAWTFPDGYSLFWDESVVVSCTAHYSGPALPVEGTTITNTIYGVTASNASAVVMGTEEVTVTVVGEAYLDAVKSATPTTIVAVPGDTDVIAYTIVVTNLPAASAHAGSVWITDVVPANTTLIDAGFGPGTLGTVIAPSTSAGSVITWQLSSAILIGESATVTFDAAVSTPIDDGTRITNTAWVSYANASTRTHVVTTTVQSTVTLHIVKMASAVVGAGELLTYTLTYSNSGTMVASGVSITDTMDPSDGATLVSADPPATVLPGNVLFWSLPDLAPGSQGQIVVVVRVKRSLDDQVITNVARMGCDQGVYVDTEPVLTLVEARKIEVSKTVSPPLVRAGDRLAYTIVFTNASDVVAQNVYITDTLPAGFTGVISDTTDAFFNRRDGNAYGWFVATMPAGGTGTIAVSANAITTSIESGGTVFWNTVETTSTQATTPVSDVVPVTVIPGWAAATTVAIVPATTLVGIPADVSVTVVDRYGNPIYDGDGYFVSLAGEPAGLTFDPTPVTLVNGQGTATVDSPTVGTFTVTAMVVGRPDLSDTALVTFTPDVLDHFVVGPIADQTAGLNFTIAITAVDQNNNPVVDFSGVVRIEDGATPETLQPDTTAPFVNGVLVGQVVSITLARTSSPIVVRAGSRVTTSNPFTVRAGPPAEITVSTSQFTIPVGYDEPVTATVVDAYGNPVPGQELTFGVSGGTANPVVSTTHADGVATSYISSMLPGEATVLVTARNGVTGSTWVTFLACPDRVTVTVDPTFVQVGQSAVVTVQAEDANGNAISWGSVDLTAADLGPGGGIDPARVSLASGEGTARIVSTLVGAKTVVATTVPEARCAPVWGQGVVTFTASAVADLAVGMLPNPQRAGEDAQLFATTTDQYGNPVAGVSIAFAATPGGLGSGGIYPDTATTDKQGVATTNISSTLIGQANVTATVTTMPAISDTEMVFFTAGPPRSLTLVASPAAVEGSELATLVVTMTDAYGNACAWQPITFSVAPPYALGTNTWIQPNPATADERGIATAVISATELGTVTITAQGASAYTATAVLTITTGPLVGFETSDVPDPVGAGVNFTLHITAVDARGNVRTQDSGSIVISDTTGTVQPTIAAMNNGVATAVLSITRAMVNDWILLTWADDPSIVKATNAFTVTGGEPATISLDYRPVLSACVPEAIVATVSDAYGNPVPGQVVHFTHSGVGSITPETDTTDLNGQATTTISSTALGPATVQAQVATVPAATANVTFQVGPPAEMTLISTADVISAGDSLVFTATVVDCGGRLAVNELIYSGIYTQVSSGGGVITPAFRATDASGQAAFVFTGTLMGQVVVAVADERYFEGRGGVYEEFAVTVEAGPPATVTLAADPDAIVPNGVATSTLVATVQDAYGNPVSDQVVRFVRLAGLSDVTLNPLSGVTDGKGQVRTTLTAGTTEGTVAVQAECAGITTTREVRVRWFKVYTPLVMKKYPVGDLIVSAIQVLPEGDGLYEVRVTVQNLGPETVKGGFWVDLYLNPEDPVGLNVLWHHVSRRGKAWYVSQELVPGQQIVLSTKDPDNPGAPGYRYSYWPGDIGRPGDHELWVMVDCYGIPPFGAVGEIDEENNIKGPVIYTIPRS